MKNPESFVKKGIARLGVAGVLAAGSLALNSDQRFDGITQTSTEFEIPFNEEDLKIMTANVHSWSYRGSDVAEMLINVIEEERPDVVCLQEVRAWGGNLQKLAEEGYNTLFATTYYHPINGPFGNAVISKNPLRLIDVLDLPNDKTISPRNAIHFEIQNQAGEWLPLANTHLSINGHEREEQLKQISEVIGEQIIGACGDANDVEQVVRDNIVALSSPSNFRQHKAEVVTPQVDSFPAISPDRAIDMVIMPCGEQNQPTKAEEVGSDHLAVIKYLDVSNCNY